MKNLQQLYKAEKPIRISLCLKTLFSFQQYQKTEGGGTREKQLYEYVCENRNAGILTTNSPICKLFVQFWILA